MVNTIVSCSEKETASTHINKAKTYITQNKLDEGIIELKNAIKQEPKNAEARFLLGKLYLQQGSAFEAVKELEKAKKLKYTNHKTIPLLARAYMLINSDDDILALNEQASKLPDEVRIQFLAYKTLAALRTENTELAKETEKFANDLSNSNSYSLLASTYLYLSENKLEFAKAKIVKLLETSQNIPDALMLKGQIDTALGNHDEAIKSYLKYAKLQPKSGVVSLFLADAYLNEKKFDEAEEYADSILSQIPNQPLAHYIKAVTRFENKDFKLASKHAEQAFLVDFNTPKLRLVAGASAFYQNNFEQSYYHLGMLIKHLPADHPAKKMFAISQLQLGLVSEITETLGGFTAQTKSDAQFLSTLSFQLAEIGAVEDAKVLANKATLNNESGNAEEKARSGLLKLMLNDPTAIESLESAITLKPDMLEAELALAAVAVKANDFDKALEIAMKLEGKYPDKPASYNVMASVYLKQGKTDFAKKALNKSLALQPKNFFALPQLIDLNMGAGNTTEVKRLSKLALDYFPDNTRVLKQQYAISRTDEVNRKQATQRVKALYASDKSNIAFGELYSEVLLDYKKYKEAIKVINGYPVSIQLPKKVWQLKVFAQRKVNSGEPLISMLELWSKTNPYHVEPILLLVDFYLKSKNLQKALSVIEDGLVANKASNSLLKIAKMQTLLDGRKLSQAKSFYKEFASGDMNKKIIDGMKGRILLLENKFAQATPLLLSFYTTFPSSQAVMLLAVSHKGEGHTDNAIATLKVYLVEHSNDNNVRSLLANYYLETAPEKSIPLYEAMLAVQPNNIMFLNNLAWLNLEDHNLQLALKYSASAIELAPNHPSVLDTRGMVLFKSGERKLALKVLKKAYELSKGQDIDTALNLVEVLISNKENIEALTILRDTNTQNRKQEERAKYLKALAG